ncbi:hypothetical protein B9Y66_12065 [Stenotrophomonas maltophilia]|nr:hypothetical protein B9Y66_12065 [Stenotrophomonas maltophilia]
MTVMIRILLASCMLLPMVASGQQPGTPQYNSVFLPGHGVGDTARSSVNRWGGWARGSDQKTLGWTVSGRSEQEARALAVSDCEARGGNNCAVVKTFVNACAAIAAGSMDRWAEISPKSLRQARRGALEACGPDCKIIFEGCARS